MNAIQFWILNFISVVVALLIGFEIYSDRELDKVSVQLQTAQAPIAEAQQLQPLLINLLKRLIKEAPQDTGLKNLLAKYGIKPNEQAPPATTPITPPATPSTPNPATPSTP